MKFLVPVFALLTLTLAGPLGAVECGSHGDCMAGCRRPGSNPVTGAWACLPRGEVGARNGDGLCQAPPGGPECGCKAQRCEFMSPEEKSKPSTK